MLERWDRIARRGSLHHVGVRRSVSIHGNVPRVRGHHGLSWRWNRVVGSRGRPAHGAFSAEGEAAVGGRGVGGELERGLDGIVAGVQLDALTGEDGVDVVEVKPGDVSLEKGIALEEVDLDEPDHDQRTRAEGDEPMDEDGEEPRVQCANQ